MQERVAIPDFLYARCFFENEAARGAISLYTIATPHVFRSAPYRKAFASRTDWSLRNFACMRDTERRVGELVLDIIQGKTAVAEAGRA